MNDPRHPRHLTHLAPGHHSSHAALHNWLGFAFFCPKSLSSAAISLRSDLTQSGQIETTASSGQRVLMTSNYWSQELESEWRGAGTWPARVNRITDTGVKQSPLGSMPAVLCRFLPCSSSFDWSWDPCSTGLQLAALFSPELWLCSPGQPRPAGCAARSGRALALGSPADLSRLRSCQSCVTHRESPGMADTTIRFRCLALALFSPPIGPVSAGQPIRGGWGRW